MRLLEVYQKAYIRNEDYKAWKAANYNNIAVELALGNSFRQKGKSRENFPEWEDQTKKMERPKITKENIESEFRKDQIKQNGWLRNLLNKYKG